MKTLSLLSTTALCAVLFLFSCRHADEITDQPVRNAVAETVEEPATSFEEPKDPPKDVPKDRDNWRSATHGK